MDRTIKDGVEDMGGGGNSSVHKNQGADYNMVPIYEAISDDVITHLGNDAAADCSWDNPKK